MRYLNCFRALLMAGVAVGVVIAGSGQTTDAQGFSRQINGQVRYAESRTPAENVLVRLESLSGGLVGQVVTDRTGKFSFSGLRAEQFIVTLHAPGYKDYQETVELMTANTGYINVQLVRDKSSLVNIGSDAPGVLDANIPLDAQNQYIKAKALIDEGKDVKTKEAILDLEKAIAIYPGFIAAQLMLGLAHMDLKQWDGAEKAFLAAIEISPDASTAYFALGEVYRREKKYTEGEKILLEGLKRNGDSAEGHATLAELYWDMAPASANEQMFKTRLASSWTEVNRALKIKPSLANAQLLAGNLLFKARRAKDALPHFEEYLKLAPNGAFASDVRSLVQKIKLAMAQNGKS